MPTLSPVVTIWSNTAISSAVLPLLPEKASISTPLMCSLQRKELLSSMNEITNGTVLGCSGTPFLSVQLVLPHKVGIKPVQMVPTCLTPRNSVLRVRAETNGLSVQSTPSSF
uniref:Unplaced genomic scaffold supercont1.54, whole genome shotgun sequence n=1 Tax=Cryptococcus bacillisporus CA1280 TaxID=1296109 RepID=A0A0D0VC71_CRYGA|nr:hypothetical protein I312_06755 [Cryptococcus bacillisporus CA1280]